MTEPKKLIDIKDCDPLCDHSAIRWNPDNQVIQCHICGERWGPPDVDIKRLAHLLYISIPPSAKVTELSYGVLTKAFEARLKGELLQSRQPEPKDVDGLVEKMWDIIIKSGSYIAMPTTHRKANAEIRTLLSQAMGEDKTKKKEKKNEHM